MSTSMDQHSTFKSTFTITYGEVAENHVGNQQIGDGVFDHGLSSNDLRKIETMFHSENTNSVTELINLKKYIDDDEITDDVEDAYILIIRNGVDTLLQTNDGGVSGSADDMFNEQNELKKDTKYFDIRRNKVLNKLARHNLCFDFEGQDADYESGKGTVIDFNHVPYTYKVRDILGDMLNEIGYDGDKIRAEGNYYYDPTKCGIGFHGDSERRIVIGVRLGVSIPLHYQWYQQSQEIGIRCKLELNHGDIYFMSDKAVGHDWKKRIVPTLRHAAGADKYLKLPKNETITESSSTSVSKIRNPETGRMIMVGRGVYNSLLKKGYNVVDGTLVITS